MAYGRRTPTPQPPRAFMGSNEASIYAAIRTMSAEQRHMAVRNITVEDLRQLFIPAHLRHSLKEAFSVASPRFTDQELVVEVTMSNPIRNLADKAMLLATFKWDHNTAPEGFFVPREEQVRPPAGYLRRTSREVGLRDRQPCPDLLGVRAGHRDVQAAQHQRLLQHPSTDEIRLAGHPPHRRQGQAGGSSLGGSQCAGRRSGAGACLDQGLPGADREHRQPYLVDRQDRLGRRTSSG